MISPEEVAWAAGIYEGEGCVSWTSAEKRCQEAIVIQKERWILDKLVGLFGGHVDQRGDRIFPSGKKFASFRWRLSGPNARGFLRCIYSWLSPHRQEQIKEKRCLEGDFTPYSEKQLTELLGLNVEQVQVLLKALKK